ncbi:topoisomerase C-terminal repeat-containing protein [Bacillus cereus]
MLDGSIIKKILSNQVKKLLEKNITEKISGFVDNKGTKFDAKLTCDSQ